MSRMISKLLDDARKELVARCKAHGNAGGMILRPVNGAREITDLRSAYLALRDFLPKEEFLKACSVSITKLESSFIAIQRNKGTYRDDNTSRQEFDNALGPALGIRPERYVLCKAPTHPAPPPSGPLPPYSAPLDDDIL